MGADADRDGTVDDRVAAGSDDAQLVSSDLVRGATAPATGRAVVAVGVADDDDADRLLLGQDPDATARMQDADFDPADTLDPDREVEELELSRCALTISVQTSRIDVSLIAGRGEVVAAQRIPASSLAVDADADSIFDMLIGSVDSVLHAVGIEPDEATALPGIGVVTTGRIDSAGGTVSPPGLPAWQAFPLRDKLSDHYQLAVKLLSSAAAVCAGEHWRGAARGRRSALGLVLGNGIDGAVVIDGRFVGGTTGNAGHIGHVCVDPYGPACACGGRGCLEAVAGGAAIAEWARTHGGTDPSADAAEVAEAARRGDPVALATFRRAGEAIGQAVAGVVTLLDLDVVVVGGPLIAAGPVLFDPIADGYHRFAALGYAAPARVVPALLGRDGGQIGAAAAVLEPAVYPVG
jgi:glucokinase